MNYPQSLIYLNSFYDLEKTMHLPASRRWKLERMRHLLEAFGQPQKSFLPVVIVGTKGKGSTGFFLQSILKEARIPVGFYSSPHLESPRERIRINGEIISERLWAQILTEIKQRINAKTGMTFDRGYFTYFEVMTLMAALAFKEAGVKTAVFEAGMGGRLDAVNALGATIVIVTPIHLDHQEFLGKTIAKIAAEKAAVIHAGADVIMAPQKKEAEDVIRTRVKQEKARLWPVMQKVRPSSVGLQGEHQVWNASAAVLASEIVSDALNVMRFDNLQQRSDDSGKSSRQARAPISAKAVKKGLAAKDWPGRFEVFQGRPKIILDGAHNPAAIEVLVKTLQQTQGSDSNSRILIFGVTRDKDSESMLKKLTDLFSTIILVPLSTPRGKSTMELLQESRHYFPTQIPALNLEEAVRLGKILAGSAGTLVVTGSFYLIGAMQTQLRHNRKSC